MWEEIIERALRNNAFNPVVNNPFASFGPVDQPYLGQLILPERVVPSNEFTEHGMKQQAVIANSGAQHSPVQMKSSRVSTSQSVSLGYSDIGDQFTAADMEQINRQLYNMGQERASMARLAALLDWAKKSIADPLHMLVEKQRWDAISNASVTLTGDDNYGYSVSYENPSGHRFTSNGHWNNNSYDPIAGDIIPACNVLLDKGFRPKWCFCGTTGINLLRNNEKVRTRAGIVSIMSGTVTGLAAGITNETLNALLSQDYIPPIQAYDAQYWTQAARAPMLGTNKFVIIGETRLSDRIIFDSDHDDIFLNSVLGYSALGIPSGSNVPERRSKFKYHEEKPESVNGQGWQATLPVILEPEAIAVITFTTS